MPPWWSPALDNRVHGATCLLLLLVTLRGAPPGTPPAPLWASVYAPVACCYLQCLVFWLAVRSAGESFLRSSHAATAVRTLVHGHVSTMLVMFVHAGSARSTPHPDELAPDATSSLLAQACILEGHSLLLAGVGHARARVQASRMTAEWALRIATFLCCSLLQASAGASLRSYVSLDAYRLALQLPCAPVLFLLPPFVTALAGLAGGVAVPPGQPFPPLPP